MLETIKVFLGWVEVFFILYLLGYSTFLFLSVAIGSAVLYGERYKERYFNELRRDFYQPVSILVPAFNEEVTVLDTVESLLHLDYRLYEIVVVDDGSTDATAKTLIGRYHMKPAERSIQQRIATGPVLGVYESMEGKVPITLVVKKNGGKADSLNVGINVSRYPYFICMDADSVLQRDALENIMRPILEDSSIVACGGLVRIANGMSMKEGRVVHYRFPKNLLVCMQILEYDRSFLASRILLDRFNGNLIISGAFGLFKKEVVAAAGGYDAGTLGEDMELVVKLHVFCRTHGIPYRIKYVPDAICWSQAPGTLGDLCKQRRRWHLGLYQTMSKYRRILMSPHYGLVGFVSYTYFVLYELLSPFIELFGLLSILLAWGADLLNTPFMIVFYVMYAVFGAILTLTAFFARIHTLNLRLSPGDVLKAFLICLLENMGLRFVVAWVRMTAFVGYKRRKLQWDKVARTRMNEEAEP